MTIILWLIASFIIFCLLSLVAFLSLVRDELRAEPFDVAAERKEIAEVRARESRIAYNAAVWSHPSRPDRVTYNDAIDLALLDEELTSARRTHHQRSKAGLT